MLNVTELSKKYSNLIFLNECWEHLLEKTDSNFILLTNDEGRPATPSIKELCNRYPNILTDMLLTDNKVIEHTRVVTDYPAISVLDSGLAIFHAPVYDKAYQMGVQLNVDKFVQIIDDILINYIFEVPDDLSICILMPPNLGDPMHEFMYLHLNDLSIKYNLEIIILQDNL